MIIRTSVVKICAEKQFRVPHLTLHDDSIGELCGTVAHRSRPVLPRESECPQAKDTSPKLAFPKTSDLIVIVARGLSLWGLQSSSVLSGRTGACQQLVSKS
eukprot:437644-Amphidinium_carterae.1